MNKMVSFMNSSFSLVECFYLDCTITHLDDAI